MKTEVPEELNVLVVGNNPIELSRLFDTVNTVPGKRVITEIAFDLTTLLDRLSSFKPHYILIDDNIGKTELLNTLRALIKNRRTNKIPITLLKNSNYREVAGLGVMDYVLKETMTGESLYKGLKNILKVRRTQYYLQSAYRKRKGQLARLLS
jgi:PleD family two-component response regulator